jgi:hypothetical protein
MTELVEHEEEGEEEEEEDWRVLCKRVLCDTTNQQIELTYTELKITF